MMTGARQGWFRLLAVLFVLVVAGAASGCEEMRKRLYSPRIKVRCDVLRKQCRFHNFGDPGESCILVEVFHRESGRVVRSNPVCSGHLERDDPVWIDVSFGEQDPVALCMGEDMRQDFKQNCEVTISDMEMP